MSKRRPRFRLNGLPPDRDHRTEVGKAFEVFMGTEISGYSANRAIAFMYFKAGFKIARAR